MALFISRAALQPHRHTHVSNYHRFAAAPNRLSGEGVLDQLVLDQQVLDQLVLDQLVLDQLVTDGTPLFTDRTSCHARKTRS
ncbi:hypothetical protein EYF80_038786 [Liparis tanakae]|uniref:Uncharacterized protein n=1 Tax=Liparis tanakae TaxID=230148 RepID=A0A4Z2GE38_9TELE|nr:hypothetical protein EYF80_038786 [Liparis tanakae]